MSLTRLAAATLKEAHLVLRDREALAVLFLTPFAFVVIMSLALQDVFRPGATPQFNMAIVDGDGGTIGRAFTEQVTRIAFLRHEAITVAPDAYAARAQRTRAEVHAGTLRFALLVPPGATRVFERAVDAAGFDFSSTPDQVEQVTVQFVIDPTVRPEHRALAQFAVDRIVQGVEFQLRAARLAQSMGMASASPAPSKDAKPPRALMRIETETAGAEGKAIATPTATQQNVPAYTLLSMFLLVVPLSATFIREREQGSLTRLRSMPVPAWILIVGKIPPYFVVNLLQLGLCLAIGRYLLPVLGGDALSIGSSVGGMLLLASAASIAAIGFGLVVAMFARTPEQATAFGSASVLVLAALGGVMVPKVVMPPTLQSIAEASPLAWALDGFLELFVRDAGIEAVTGRAAMLVAFGVVCLVVAAWRYRALVRAR